MEAEHVDTMPERSQPSTLLASSVVALAMSVAGSTGVYHIKAPEDERQRDEIERRLDNIERNKTLIEYQIRELQNRGLRCQGDKYSALAGEGVKVDYLK